MITDPLTHLREICLAFPEAVEQLFFDDPSFRIRDKIFAQMRYGEGFPAVWFKAEKGLQAILIEANPERYYAPPYVGSKGWVGCRFDVETDWDELALLLEDSYRLIAPKSSSRSCRHGEPFDLYYNHVIAEEKS